jgi:hypothetical protein
MYCCMWPKFAGIRLGFTHTRVVTSPYLISTPRHSLVVSHHIGRCTRNFIADVPRPLGHNFFYFDVSIVGALSTAYSICSEAPCVCFTCFCDHLVCFDIATPCACQVVGLGMVGLVVIFASTLTAASIGVLVQMSLAAPKVRCLPGFFGVLLFLHV